MDESQNKVKSGITATGLDNDSSRAALDKYREHFDEAYSIGLQYWKSYRKAKHNDDFEKAEACLYSGLEELKAFHDCYAGNSWAIKFQAELGDFEGAQSRLAEADEAGLLGQDVVNSSLYIQNEQFQKSQTQKRVERTLNLCILAKDFQRAWRFYQELKDLCPDYFTKEAARQSNVPHERFLYEGIVFHGLNRSEDALHSFEKASVFAEAQRLDTSISHIRFNSFGSFASGSIFPHAALICIQYAQAAKDKTSKVEWANRALHYVEQGKARSLLDNLIAKSQTSKHKDNRSSNNTERLWREIRSTPDPVNQDEKALRKRRIRELQKTLEQDNSSGSLSPLMSAAVFDFSTEVMCSRLSQDTAVIELAVCDEGTCVILVTTEGIAYSGLLSLDRKKTHQLVSRFRNALTGVKLHGITDSSARQALLDKDTQDRQSVINELSQQLISPLKDLVRSKRHLVFIPSGPFANFPFSTLNFEGEPLLIKFATSIAPSLTSLYMLAEKAPISPSTDFAAITDAGSGTDHIPCAALEGIFASYLFDAWPESPQVAGLDVSNTLQSASARHGIIHVTCHGKFDSKRPWLSTLLLGTEVYALDFADFECQAALLVFSACMTAEGRNTYADDLLGFAHTILGSGAKIFMGALWSVSDAVSLILMYLFYRNLAHDREVRIVDLWRKAQLELYELDDAKLGELKKEFRRIWNKLDQDEVSRERRDGLVFMGDRAIEKLFNQLPLNLKDAWCWSGHVMVGLGDIVLPKPHKR